MSRKVVVQARMNSTRLPEKMRLDFFQGKTIPEIVLETLLGVFESREIVLATTVAQPDSWFEEVAAKYNTGFYRGSENDVLQRFLDVAERDGVQEIIRVCADNPFLMPSFLEELRDIPTTEPSDYVSFSIDGIPAIRTHFGFFAEWVRTTALKKAAESTREPLYREHVTNFIYSHPGDFSIRLMEVPELNGLSSKIRLTIDTRQDFENAKSLYSQSVKKNRLGLGELISMVTRNEQLLGSMQNQIKENTK